MPMRSSFLSLPLQIGAIIVGWTSLITGTLLLGCIIMRLLAGPGGKESIESVITGVVIATIFCAANIGVSIVLLFGAYKCKRPLLIPFLIFSPLVLIILLLFLIFSLLWMEIWSAIIGLLALGIGIYFVMVIYSFFKSFMAERSRRTPEESYTESEQSYSNSVTCSGDTSQDLSSHRDNPR